MIIEYLSHTEKIPLSNLAFDTILIYLAKRIKLATIIVSNFQSFQKVHIMIWNISNTSQLLPIRNFGKTFRSSFHFVKVQNRWPNPTLSTQIKKCRMFAIFPNLQLLCIHLFCISLGSPIVSAQSGQKLHSSLLLQEVNICWKKYPKTRFHSQ